MNTKANLIIANGKIITSDTKYCKYNIYTHKYDITFYNNKTYSYNYLNVRWLMNPKVLNPNDFIISYNGKMLYNISEIYIYLMNFGTLFLKTAVKMIMFLMNYQ